MVSKCSVVLLLLACVSTPALCQPRVTVNIGTQTASPSTAGGSGSGGLLTSPSTPQPSVPQALPAPAVPPSQTASFSYGYTQLNDKQTVNGVVGKGKSDIYRFGGNNLDFLLSLTPYNSGDADLYCGPAVAGFSPNPIDNVWSSDFSEGQDFIFISRNDTGYQIASNSSGVADFICAVYGWSDGGTQYRLALDTTTRARSLVGPEQQALANVYSRCCNQSTCLTWDLINADSPGSLYTDFCYVGANVCDDEGYLIRLDLRRFGLTCNFPFEDIAVLSRLRKLSLQRNGLQGDIASVAMALQNFTLLETVDLSCNNLTGVLGGNDAWCLLANMSMRLLNLEFNEISGAVPACLLGPGSQIRELLLAYNNMTGIIPNVTSLNSQLDAMDLTFNQISGTIPASLANAQELTTLALAFNNLTGQLPESLGSLPVLKSLRLAGNTLSGSIPESFGLSRTLAELNLNGNNFTGLPSAWYNPGQGVADALAYVDVGSNALSGPFPGSLLLSENLTALFIDDNALTGPLPEAPVLFPNGRVFNASGNRLTGSIPQGLAGSAIFEGLHANASQAVRRLPHVLDLSNNDLEGPIPTFLYQTNLPDILVPSIFLAGNSFDCPLPAEVSYIRNVTCGGGRAGTPVQSPESSPTVTSDSPYGVERANARNRADADGNNSLSGGAIFGIVIAALRSRASMHWNLFAISPQVEERNGLAEGGL